MATSTRSTGLAEMLLMHALSLASPWTDLRLAVDEHAASGAIRRPAWARRELGA